jgi:hypothetical protein
VSGLLGRRAVVVGAGIGGLSMAGALANILSGSRFSNATACFHPPLRGPELRRTGTRMVCSPAVSRRSVKFFRASIVISRELVQSPSGSHETSNTSGRMLECCQSGTSGCRCSVRRDL